MNSIVEIENDVDLRYPGIAKDQPLAYCYICGRWHPTYNMQMVMGKMICYNCLGRSDDGKWN